MERTYQNKVHPVAPPSDFGLIQSVVGHLSGLGLVKAKDCQADIEILCLEVIAESDWCLLGVGEGHYRTLKREKSGPNAGRRPFTSRLSSDSHVVANPSIASPTADASNSGIVFITNRLLIWPFRRPLSDYL
jgi:hypothetical protein